MDERLVAAEQAVPAGQEVALEPALAEVLGQDLHDPPGRRLMLVGRAGSRAIQTRSVASNTASSRLEDVSSGPNRRKVDGLSRMTSRSHVPSTRVASWTVVPGASTATAYVPEVRAAAGLAGGARRSRAGWR